MSQIKPASIVGGCIALLSVATFTDAAASTNIQIPAKVCDVSAYGANGERQQILLNTEPFQRAIDDCAAAGGGTVRVPRGNYLVAPLMLKSNIRLQLDKGSTIVASTVEASYRATRDNKSAEAENGWLPFISIDNAQNVAISGQGSIDGQGAVWWERWRANVRETPAKRSSTDRPRLIYIKNSRNILVEGVTLTNSPSFHVVMRYSEDVDVNGTRIISPAFAPNTDAIDPIDSRNVRITNNFIDCNDDHVAIKAEKLDPRYPDGVTSNIYVGYNTLKGGRGISIGSETAGGVSNVLVEHNNFEGSMYGLRIKSPRGKGGKVSNVTYRDTRMVDVGVPLVLSGYYKGAPDDAAELARALAEGGFVVGDQLYPADSDPAVAFDVAKTPHFSNIKISNLLSTGESKAAAYIVGVPEAPLEGISFDNVKIEAERGMLVRNASLRSVSSQIKARKGENLILQKGGQILK
ncbi:glycoside hydrolase family 28 protein [Uliginosibacterium sediminicola]|uniref:Glycosyl hydrolase family 28 protein n=1 Tax=Uliginosibacterium sediminicola TaxID=2024550 RepID=A0ABU9YYJ5_9RHOO